MKKAIYIITLASLLVAGCYDKDFEALRAEVDDLKTNQVASLETQVKGITASITLLNELSTQLEGYITKLEKISKDLQDNLAKVNAKLDETRSSLSSQLSDSESQIMEEYNTIKNALEQRLAAVNTVIAEVKASEASINERLAALKQRADSDFATKDWAEETFATIESQTAIIDEMEAIHAKIESISQSIEAAKKTIQSNLEVNLLNASAKISKELNSQLQLVNQYITSTLETAYTDITAACTKALTDAIAESEKSVKAWVGVQLEGYYTVAEANAKVQAFHSIVGKVPGNTNLQKEIEDLEAELQAMKDSLKLEYTAAIKKAIEKSYSDMASLTDSEISKLRTELSGYETRVGTLETKVAKLLSDLSALKDRVNTVEQQKAAISNTIDELDKLYKALQEYVTAAETQLKAADAKNYEEQKGQIDKLQALADGELLTKITDLKNYVGTFDDTGSSSVVEWVQKSVTTYKKQFDLYCTIQYVDGVKARIDKALGEDATAIQGIQSKVDEIKSSAETKIMEWINAKLAKQFVVGGVTYNKETFDRLLSDLKAELEKAVKEGDADVDAKIAELKTLVESTSSALDTEITNAITEMITANDGYVTLTIKNKITELQASLASLNTKIGELQTQVGGIKQTVDEMQGDITALKTRIDSLKTFVADTGFESLVKLVEYLEGKLAEVPTTFATIDQLNEYLVMFYGEGGTLENPKEGSIQYWFNQLESLTSRLTTAQTSLGYIEKFLKEYYKDGAYTTTFDALLKALNSDITALDTEVNGTDGLIERLMLVTNALYGTGGTKEKPKEGSIWYKLQALQDGVSRTCFSSVAWLPSDGSGCASLSNLRFVVRPAALAPILADSGACSLLYTMTSTKAPTVTEWSYTDGCRFTGSSDGILKLASTPPIGAPYHVALKVSMDKGVSFTSSFILLK